MKLLSLPVATTKHITTLIQRMAAPCSIYIFGYRTITFSNKCFLSNTSIAMQENHHFDVVVFSKRDFSKGGGGVNIANAIAESSGKRITASVLLHSVTNLGTKQPSQQWFFEQVLQNGQRLCLDALAPPYLSFASPAVRDDEGDRAYWLKCVAVAQFNLQAAADSGHVVVTLCKVALLHTAVVQIALGLIRVRLGYTPNETALRALLLLCGHFTDLPAKFFYHETPQSIRCFKMLCAPPSMLQHWVRLDASERDFLWLLDACRGFLKEAGGLVDGGNGR